MKKLLSLCKDIIECDTARIVKTGKSLFFIIGFNKNTKDSPGQWYKNNKPIDFDYVKETVVASGKNRKELIESCRTYRSLQKIICIFLLSFMAGCTSVHFTETLPDQTVKEFSYFNSIFSKEITDFSYTGEGQGVKRQVKLGGSVSDANAFMAVLQSVLDNAFAAGKASAGVP